MQALWDLSAESIELEVDQDLLPSPMLASDQT